MSPSRERGRVSPAALNVWRPTEAPAPLHGSPLARRNRGATEEKIRDARPDAKLDAHGREGRHGSNPHGRANGAAGLSDNAEAVFPPSVS
jgi:hypothetical protein